METYSVREIAAMLQTNPETVRRWIRSGKLKADQSSRKDGNVIQEEDLYRFLRTTSKYGAVAAGMVAANPLLALKTAMGIGIIGIMSTVFAKKRNRKDSGLILPEDLEQTLREKISESEDTIKRKISAIAELQEEIRKEEQQITDCKAALANLSRIISVTQDNAYKEETY